jgi:hypothetical protein
VGEVNKVQSKKKQRAFGPLFFLLVPGFKFQGREKTTFSSGLLPET